MIEANELTKSYGRVTAVDRLTFTVHPGRVTGFLGPNGAGKSTTLRLLLGLDRPDYGTITVDGRPYRSLPAPIRTVGALLDARAVHGGWRGYHHLLWLAQSNGIPRRRVSQVLDLVGLTHAARRPVREYSLGMSQRLGIAAALLGDPEVLILDEPANGLDTDGIRWVRDLVRDLARQGRTVFLSSHVMSEMELTADHLIVIGRGRLLADAPMAEFIEANSRPVTVVRSPHADLASLLTSHGATVRSGRGDEIEVVGVSATVIGEIAAASNIPLHHLFTRRSTLEEVYLRMTEATVDYRGARDS